MKYQRIVLTDVYYQPSYAQAAGVVIQKWSDQASIEEHTHRSHEVAGYVSGQFYQRELPHLLSLLDKIPQYDCVVVDAHVWLTEGEAGAGHYLWRALGQTTPVIGVAKNPFRGGVALPLLRGESKKPLWVSSVGVEPCLAVEWISSMSGEHRMPTLLKRVDELSRQDSLSSGSSHD